MPAAEVAISAALVRRLLDEQHPDLADLAIVEYANGWDNALYRLGSELLVRLPRRALSAGLIENEQRWLPVLRPRLPVPIPVPVRVGVPGAGFPWAWSIVPWVGGEPVGPGPVDGERGSAELARDLGGFLAALHVPAPADAPPNPFRAVPLAERSPAALDRLQALGEGLGAADHVLRCWCAAAGEQPWIGPPMWAHGDLHPLNILHRGGRLVSVIDFGDITAGDPAGDLGVAWMLFDEPERAVFRRAADTAGRRIDRAMWSRARGNALAFALAVLQSSADNPALEQIGRSTLAAVLSDGDRP